MIETELEGGAARRPCCVLLEMTAQRVRPTTRKASGQLWGGEPAEGLRCARDRRQR